MGDVSEWQNIFIGIAVLAAVGYACFSYGRNTATDDYRSTTEQLRSELRAASDLNTSLKTDNERISKINRELAGEIGESRRLAGAIGDYNRANAERLDEAGNIVADCQRIAGEIRKGNQGKNPQPAP